MEAVNQMPNDCYGPQCPRCGKCRDWEYTGNPADLPWIQNWKNWSKSDWERYRDGTFFKSFRHRNNARCRYTFALIDGNDILAAVHLHFLGADYGLHMHTDLCLCNDNLRY